MRKLPKDVAALVYVHLGLLAAAFGAAWFVHTQSPKLPLQDEWDLLHSWVQSDTTWHWIWMHHSEHRYPLSKAIWLGILRLTGYDFAAPQYVTMALLVASATLSVWTARGLRGRSHPVDLIFPALMLHFGHGFNLQMGYQVGFGFFVYGIAGWLWCVGHSARGGGRGWDLLGGLYAASILPCGGFGLAFTPVVLFWFGFAGVRARRTGQKLPVALFGILLAAGAGYSAWIASTMPKFLVPGIGPLDSPAAFLVGTTGYLASAAGCWPGRESLDDWRIPAIAVPILMIYAVALRMLTERIDRTDGRRLIAVALLLVLVGTASVGAAAARARGGGFVDRYTSASAAGLAAAALGWIAASTLRPSGAISVASGILGLLASAGLIIPNLSDGQNRAFAMRDATHGLNLDIRAGRPPLFLAGRHSGSYSVLMGDRFAGQLRDFRRAGIPPFAALPEDPNYHPVPLALPGLPLRWIHSEAEFAGGSAPPSCALPDPPANALGLRLGVTTERSCCPMKLVLRTSDGPAGRSQESDAQPHYLSEKLHLVFPLTEASRAPVLSAGSRLDAIVIDSAEWLIRDAGNP